MTLFKKKHEGKVEPDPSLTEPAKERSAWTPQPQEEPDEHPVGFAPLFPRLGTHRRVLGHVTPEVDRTAYGPRNTLPALTYALVRDDETDISYPEQIPQYLADLVQAGLLTEADGTYTVTDRGWQELTN